MGRDSDRVVSNVMGSGRNELCSDIQSRNVIMNACAHKPNRLANHVHSVPWQVSELVVDYHLTSLAARSRAGMRQQDVAPLR